MIQIKRVGSSWVATICWLHGSLKIFADSREEAIRKSSHFTSDVVEPTLDQTTTHQ
jgi:hypothetical protein